MGQERDDEHGMSDVFYSVRVHSACCMVMYGMLPAMGPYISLACLQVFEKLQSLLFRACCVDGIWRYGRQWAYWTDVTSDVCGIQLRQQILDQ